MKKIAIAIAGFLGAALVGYLVCVWMAGYFYSPFEPSPSLFEGTSGTRYVMLCFAIFGAVLGSILGDDA